MKKLLLLSLFVLGSASLMKAQTKYGSLAIDRNDGFYYGFAYDYTTVGDAENKALSECQKRGGNCDVVLTWSGQGCAVYRTINGKVGTAYGWGIGTTREQADAIATAECLKRSNGASAVNHVWSCNSGTGTVKDITKTTAPTAASSSNAGGEEYISFNGKKVPGSGDCPGSGTAMIASDDESMSVMMTNLKGSGTFNVTAGFYKGECTDCLSVMFMDSNSGQSFIATSGSLTQTDLGISFNLTVKELNDLISGGGNSHSVSGKLLCN